MIYVYTAFWVCILIVALIYFYKFGLSHLYDYRVSERGVEFVLLRAFPVFTIKYTSIKTAREIRIFTAVDNRPSSIFTSLVIGNRITAGLIVLKMKAGIFRYIALTPADRKAFLHEVATRLSTNS